MVGEPLPAGSPCARSSDRGLPLAFFLFAADCDRMSLLHPVSMSARTTPSPQIRVTPALSCPVVPSLACRPSPPAPAAWQAVAYTVQVAASMVELRA